MAIVTKQQGFLSLEAAFAVMLVAIASFMTWTATQRAGDAEIATLQADGILAIRSAAHKLVMDNYAAYQNAEDIQKNSVVILANGDTAGTSRKPTVANLRALGLGVDTAPDEGIYKSLTTAGYDITITRAPVGCETSPLGRDCRVSGMVCLNQPLRSRNSAVGEIDSVGLGVILGKLAGKGGVSLMGTESIIAGTDGSWQVPNPYAGSPAGIVCARFGWGTENDDYLRLNDTRDPNFKGGETISGMISGTTTTLQVNGDAVVTGNIAINATAAPDAACTTDKAMLWGDIAGVPTLLVCQGGLWKVAGGTLAVVGAGCAPEGRFAQTMNGGNLVCRNSIYRRVEDLLGQQGVMSMDIYSHGAVVPSPSCGPSMVGLLVPMGVVSACVLGGGACTNNSGSFSGSVGSGNIVSIVGADGVTPAGTARLAVAGVCSSS
jgi:hypothetical protein